MLYPSNTRWCRFRNDSGEEIPAFGIVKITDAELLEDHRLILLAEKPDGEEGTFYVNGGTAVGIDRFGRCAVPEGPVWALYDDAETPANGDLWGPVNGSWELGSTGSGFTIIGDPTSGRVLVERGGPCPDRNEIHQITILGKPTGGTLSITLTVNSVAETDTVDWDATASEVKTALETHAQIAVDDIEVTGGPFPNATMQIEFVENLAATAIALPILNWASLTGGTGVAAIPSRPQSGFPN